MTLFREAPNFRRRPRTFVAMLTGIFAAFFVLAPTLIFAAAPEAKKEFNIPAGEAGVSLKQFSTQSGAQLIFPEDAIAGARTRELKGAFTPAEALDRLLAGTNLKATRDEQSGSFAVSRVPERRKETSHPNG